VAGACDTHGRREESAQGFGGKARRKETTRADRGVDWRIGSDCILGILAGGAVKSIRLAQGVPNTETICDILCVPI
jgi:hypothetical protein